MAYEVIWTKLLALIVGPTTYSFTVVLVTFIACLALGSLVFGWVADRVARPLSVLVATQVVATLGALGVSQMLGTSQFFFAKLIYHFQDDFLTLSFLKGGVLFLLMLLPTLCLGAAFPLVSKICTPALTRMESRSGWPMRSTRSAQCWVRFAPVSFWCRFLVRRPASAGSVDCSFSLPSFSSCDSSVRERRLGDLL